MAHRLYSREIIQERIAHIRSAINNTRIMSMEAIQIRLSEIGGANLKDYYNEKKTLDPFADEVGNQGAIASIEQEFDDLTLEPYVSKMKLHNPVPALDMLIKMKGGYPPAAIELTGKGGGPIVTEDNRVTLLAIIGRISTRLAVPRDALLETANDDIKED